MATTSKRDGALFVIRGEDKNGMVFYWSNDDGWVDRESATEFYADEPGKLNLPILPEGKVQWDPVVRDWMFYVQRPTAVIVKAKTRADAERIRDAVLAKGLDEESVRWYDGIEGVDRALMTEDPAEPMDKGKVEEY